MKKKAVFLDRDGTLNRDMSAGYTYRVEDYALEKGALEGLKRLQDLGFLLIIVTNQSGIGRGYYTEKDFKTFMVHMLEHLKEEGVAIDAVYYCPHYPLRGETCGCRKPETGMMEEAIEDFAGRGIEIDLEKSFMIGDKTADGLLGNRMGCRSILVLCESGKKGQDMSHSCKWDHTAEHLDDAVKWIEEQRHG